MILGLKSKSKKKNLLIEIIGTVDSAKKDCADLLARRLGGKLFCFPMLIDVNSPTSSILRNFLINRPRELEKQPEWWAHIYIAHLSEYIKPIQEAMEEGPVVVVNYTTAFRLWMRQLYNGFDFYNHGFTWNLPQPNIVFCIIGDKMSNYRNLKVDFSPEFELKIDNAMFKTKDPKVVKRVVGIVKGKAIATCLNYAVDDICQYLQKKYKYLIIDLNKIFNLGEFELKKNNGRK